MHIQSNDITPATSHNYIWRSITNKLYSLNCWYYSVVYKESCSQLMILISFSIEKIVSPCSYCASSVPPNLVTPTKSNLYLANSLAAAVSGPTLYRLLIFQVDSSWNVMAHGDAQEGKWRGNWQMEWVASTLHATSEHCVSSVTTKNKSWCTHLGCQ